MSTRPVAALVLMSLFLSMIADGVGIEGVVATVLVSVVVWWGLALSS